MSRRSRCGTAAGAIRRSDPPKAQPPAPELAAPTPADEAARALYNAQCQLAGEKLGLAVGLLLQSGVSPHAVFTALLSAALLYGRVADREAARLLTKAALEGLAKDLA